MKKGDDQVEVLNGGLMRKEEEEEEESSGGACKKRRVGEKEKVKRVTEIRLAIEELSLACKDQKTVTTSAFLSVSNLLLLILDKVGPTMTVMRQDVQRNIERLENMCVTNPTVYSNLVEILKKETDEGTAKKRDSCSRAVLWLSRSLNFSLNLMERLTKDQDSTLEEAVEESYDINFKPWHGWISSAAYRVALKLLPERKNFTDLLMGQVEDYSLLKNDIQILVSLLQPLLIELQFHLLYLAERISTGQVEIELSAEEILKVVG